MSLARPPLRHADLREGALVQGGGIGLLQGLLGARRSRTRTGTTGGTPTTTSKACQSLSEFTPWRIYYVAGHFEFHECLQVGVGGVLCGPRCTTVIQFANVCSPPPLLKASVDFSVRACRLDGETDNSVLNA